jgi:hypothetical protein
MVVAVLYPIMGGNAVRLTTSIMRIHPPGISLHVAATLVNNSKSLPEKMMKRIRIPQPKIQARIASIRYCMGMAQKASEARDEVSCAAARSRRRCCFGERLASRYDDERRGSRPRREAAPEEELPLLLAHDGREEGESERLGDTERPWAVDS